MFAGLGTAGRRTQGVYGYARSCSRHWTPKCHLSGHQPTPNVHEVTPLLTAVSCEGSRPARFEACQSVPVRFEETHETPANIGLARFGTVGTLQITPPG